MEQRRGAVSEPEKSIHTTRAQACFQGQHTQTRRANPTASINAKRKRRCPMAKAKAKDRSRKSQERETQDWTWTGPWSGKGTGQDRARKGQTQVETNSTDIPPLTNRTRAEKSLRVSQAKLRRDSICPLAFFTTQQHQQTACYCATTLYKYGRTGFSHIHLRILTQDNIRCSTMMGQYPSTRDEGHGTARDKHGTRKNRMERCNNLVRTRSNDTAWSVTATHLPIPG